MNFRKLFSLCLVAILALSFSSTAFAAEANSDDIIVEESVQPRIGIAKFDNHYHDGTSISGEYTIQLDKITLPQGKCSLQTGDFDSDTLINIEIWNDKGQQMGTYSVLGSFESSALPDKTLLNYVNGGKVTIKYDVIASNGNSEDGWIGFWFF